MEELNPAVPTIACDRPDYEAPAILWEHEFTALAACSPPCLPGQICFLSGGVEACIDPGGGG